MEGCFQRVWASRNPVEAERVHHFVDHKRLDLRRILLILLPQSGAADEDLPRPDGRECQPFGILAAVIDRFTKDDVDQVALGGFAEKGESLPDCPPLPTVKSERTFAHSGRSSR
jgi:hypothetical protein